MNIKIMFMLDSDPLLKRYLREHSSFYKNLIRNPNSINEIINLMKKDYHLTFPDKLDKIKDSISMFNNFMDIIK